MRNFIQRLCLERPLIKKKNKFQFAMSDTEILSDDDIAMIVDQIIDLDKIGNDKKQSKQIETIVIDDEKSSHSDNNNVINIGNKLTLDVDSVYRENILLAEFIEKCINLENTGGMMRIINRTLLRVFKEANKDYKNSQEFEKVLQKQINLIETDPHMKYTHIKNVIEALKSSGVKKRVKLTTLATNLKNKQEKRSANFGERKVKRSKRDIIIDLDNESNDIIPVINLDDDPNDVIVLDEPAETRIDEEKENLHYSAVNHGDVNEINDDDPECNGDSDENSYLIPRKEMFVANSKLHTVITEPVQRHSNDVMLLDQSTRNRNNEEKDNSTVNHRELNKTNGNHFCNDYEHRNSQNDSEESSYLTPQLEVFVSNNGIEQQPLPFESHTDHNGQIEDPINVENITEVEEHRRIQREIKKIESQIEKCKQIIQQLDEAEVTNDNITSPYIISEKVKSKIVSLYKTLCELTGSESVKKRTVRLQVQDGHPAGPVRRLEEFINSNIGEDGDPQFPDFRDVTMCVLQANEADGLGWSKAQILKEASALFTQCGRALQKRRQKREWRDLLATVRTESLEYDPADEDPILLAKLEQNRRIALCKETELLNRFAKMQDMPTQAKLNKVNQHLVTQNEVTIIDSCDNINVQNKVNIEVPIVNENYVNIVTHNDQETVDSQNVGNNTQNSLLIVKTEVSVEFEPPEHVEFDSSENVETVSESKESFPSSQRFQMKENISIGNKTNNSNAVVKTETFMEVETIKRNCSNSIQNESCCNSSCEVLASSKNNQKDSNATTKNNKENSQEDIFNVHNEPDLKNGAGDSLENKEINSHSKVKIKKEPVDVAALLDGLGDNFSADIFDIEDPFLVIEISDSSDDEN